MKTIVIAGANGFMGNRLLAEALTQGYHVICLARNSKDETAQERVLNELEENMSQEDISSFISHIEVLQYDITKEDLGLSAEVRARINETATDVFNFVGDTNFFPKNLKMFLATNVDGPAYMAQALCQRGQVFHHVSTAYVSGNRSGVILESELDVEQKFKNDYEQYKMIGEKRIIKVCTDNDIKYNIFRPSIVIRRHSVHGKSPNLNHFYSFVGLIDILRQDAQNQEHASKKDPVNIPVRFPGNPRSTLNMVDLDYSVSAVLAISQKPHEKDETYHLVNPAPLSNQEFIDIIMDLYEVTGFEIVEDVSSLKKLTFRERLIKRGLSNYIDYFFVKPDYDDTHTRNALKGTGITCPPFDSHYIASATGHLHK